MSGGTRAAAAATEHRRRTWTQEMIRASARDIHRTSGSGRLAGAPGALVAPERLKIWRAGALSLRAL